MIAIPLLAVMLIGAPQESAAATTSAPPVAATPQRPHLTLEQQEQIKQKMEQFKASREPERREAIRINDLAADVKSEPDARKLVDAVAEQLTHHRHLLWAAQSYRHRVAHAEFEAVSDPFRLIPEQRIVDVWNEYAREIDAPEEALITTTELHKLRAMDIHFSQHNWQMDVTRSIWSMPNIYATDGAGGPADGCRALEALKLIHDLHEQFFRVHLARQNVGNAFNSADVLPTRPNTMVVLGRLATSSSFRSQPYQDPIRAAAARYQQEHGSHGYDQLVKRLFDELLPQE
jgi:hypothetical protein